jgi:membrane protein YqaA with SNARE-associated domain
VRVDFYAFDMDPDGLSTFAAVGREPDWWVNRASVAGGLLGALAGWWLARWARRCFAEKNPRFRTAIRETAVIGVALVSPALVQSALRWSGSSWEPAGSYSVTLLLGYARWPAALGVLLLAGAVVALAVRRGGRPVKP